MLVSLVNTYMSSESQWSKAQVIEEVQSCMSIEQHDLLLGNRSGLMQYEFGYIFERTTERLEKNEHLPLGGIDSFRVEVPSLQEREPQLSWSGLIGIRCRKHNTKTKVFDALSSLNWSMVRSSVHYDNYFTSPIFPVLRCEHGAQSGEKQLHNLFVCHALSLC